MLLFFTDLLLIITIITLVKKKKQITPIFVFMFIWSVIITFYVINPYDFFNISFETECILSLGIFAFCLGYFFRDNQVLLVKTKEKKIDNFFFWNLISIVCIVCSLNFYPKAILNIIHGGSIATNKYMLVTGEMDLGGPLMQFIVRPLEYPIIAVSAYCFFYQKEQKLLLISGVYFTLGRFLGMGSRMSVMYTFICLLVLYFTNNKEIKAVSKKKMFLVAFSITISLYLILIMGKARIVSYACGCIPMLDKIVEGDFYNFERRTYGFLSFNSIIRFVIKGFGMLGVNINSDLFDIANSYYTRFEYTTEIGPNIRYNAFHTMFGDFYIDFGICGVAVMSSLFGFYTNREFQLYLHKKSLYDYILLCIIMFCIASSMVRFQMSNTFIGLGVLYSIIIKQVSTLMKKIRIK